MLDKMSISVQGQGFYDISSRVGDIVARAGLKEGLCTLFIKHTSASLLIQENYDPSVQEDLQNWMNRLVPENDPLYTHTMEGPDDMPAHIKSTLTNVSLSVPIEDGRLALGTWQGIYLWEHRRHRGNRQVLVHLAP
jgi:secondary thiamine-phosphate synthase enzyme